MQVELKVNGKTVHAEISEEQAKILGLIEDKPKTGYERREECNNKKYYFVNTIDLVIENENTVLFDQNRYDVGNYYSDKTIAENNARADRLLRRLRQWQGTHDRAISTKDWQDKTLCLYSIKYNYSLDMLYAHADSYCRGLNNIYFTSEKIVKEAIEQFKDELEWYYTEYVQRLDEVWD